MDDLSFKERLRQAVKEHAKMAPDPSMRPANGEGDRHGAPHGPHDSSKPPEMGGGLEELLEGTWHETDGGSAFIRDEVFPSDHVHGRLALNTLLDRSRSALADVLHEERVPAISKLGFLDLETTGLSAGTGTYFFLAGLGTYTETGFRVRQYFLADLRHEPAMLSALSYDLRQLDAVVT